MRPIDADALIKRLKTAEEVTETFFGSVEPKIVEIHKSLTDEMIAQVEKEPGIVRCRDCKHRPLEKDDPNFWEWFGKDCKCPWFCADTFYMCVPPEDFFCAYGERKDDQL